MNKKVSVIHTVPVTAGPLHDVFSETLPDVDIVNIIDDSLLKEVIASGSVTKGVIRRLCQYMVISQDMGADVILNVCSSVGEVVDIARNFIDIPIIRLDDAMAEKAVQTGNVIGVVATVSTTLNPTVNLIQRKAEQRGKSVIIKSVVCSNAFKALTGGDTKMHDMLLLNCVKKLALETDLILFAQASAARLVPETTNYINIPVLSSPRLGVESVKRAIYGS